MRLLFDQNSSFRILQRIPTALPTADNIKNLGLENTSDFEIWDFLKEQYFTIVRLDCDFIGFSLNPPTVII